jgi:hypothetical protein
MPVKLLDFVTARLKGERDARQGLYSRNLGNDLIEVLGESGEKYQCILSSAVLVPDENLLQIQLQKVMEQRLKIVNQNGELQRIFDFLNDLQHFYVGLPGQLLAKFMMRVIDHHNEAVSIDQMAAWLERLAVLADWVKHNFPDKVKGDKAYAWIYRELKGKDPEVVTIDEGLLYLVRNYGEKFEISGVERCMSDLAKSSRKMAKDLKDPKKEAGK